MAIVATLVTRLNLSPPPFLLALSLSLSLSPSICILSLDLNRIASGKPVAVADQVWPGKAMGEAENILQTLVGKALMC